MDKKSDFKSRKNAVIIVIIVLFYTFYEMSSLHFIHGRYSKIIKTSTEAICSLGEIKDAMNDIDNTVMKIVTGDGTNTLAYIEKINEEIDECKEAMEEYEELDVSDEQKEAFELFEEKFDTVDKSLTEIVSAVNINNMTRVNKLYNDKFSPARADAEVTIEDIFDNSVESQEESLVKLRRHRHSNNITMYIIAFVIIAVLLVIDKRRAKMNKELHDTQEKVEKQKDKISTAVFKDVLTETNNRMSFINKFSKNTENVPAGQAAYFIMFNIDDFSSVNSTHGVASGDMILSSTAEKIRSTFDNKDVYRTGSDEFVVVMSASADADGYNRVSGLVDRARIALGAPHKIRNGSLIVSYSVSVVKKNGPCTLDTSVLGPLKETMKEGRITQPGAVMFTELN